MKSATNFELREIRRSRRLPSLWRSPFPAARARVSPKQKEIRFTLLKLFRKNQGVPGRRGSPPLPCQNFERVDITVKRSIFKNNFLSISTFKWPDVLLCVCVMQSVILP